MSFAFPHPLAFRHGVVGSLALGLLIACGSDDVGTRAASVAPIEAGAAACSAQREGCICADIGAKVVCSIKTHLDNGDTLCEGGDMLCGDERTWGRCVGNGQTAIVPK